MPIDKQELLELRSEISEIYTILNLIEELPNSAVNPAMNKALRYFYERTTKLNKELHKKYENYYNKENN